MPKVVDHEARRRQIAEAVFSVVGSRGLAGVSLRDVAQEAKVSMGSVQHYFGTKDDMLLFALGYMRERAGLRFESELAQLKDPSTREYLRTVLRVLLPTTEQGRQEATVNIAFFSVAPTIPQYQRILVDGYSQLSNVVRQILTSADADGDLKSGVDVEAEAAALFYATQGLIGPVLIGALSSDEAVDILDHQLDRLFASPQTT